MIFPGFYGNQGAKDRLSAMEAAGRFPHALILEGPAGCGKRTLARIVARALLCEGETKPCGVCGACVKSGQGAHPDLITAGGGSGPRSFHIDVIRQIREDVSVIPNEGKVKVYVLENAGAMTEQAQNALLKVLEEPPAYVRFLLTCESASQLLPTILSRAPVIRLSTLSAGEAAQALVALRPGTPLEQAEAEGALWDGNLGRMLESLEDGTLSKAEDLAVRMALAVPAEKELDLLLCAAPLQKDKELTRAVLSRLSLLFRDCLLLRSGVQLSQASEAWRPLSARLTRHQLLRLLEVTRAAAAAMDRYANHSLLVTSLCAGFRQAADRSAG